ncbi:hypothetical protein [Kitasatospora sp. NPDC092286]|uniref:hypothetical protein n=1 Tax=Kitasatospora sp. NPDC092286 TaxID=3364087 RepID=UPI003816780E
MYDVYAVDSGNNSGKFTYLTQSGAGYTSTTPSWYSWTFSPGSSSPASTSPATDRGVSVGAAPCDAHRHAVASPNGLERKSDGGPLPNRRRRGAHSSGRRLQQYLTARIHNGRATCTGPDTDHHRPDPDRSPDRPLYGHICPDKAGDTGPGRCHSRLHAGLRIHRQANHRPRRGHRGHGTADPQQAVRVLRRGQGQDARL